jgi:hypothetical protein
MSRWVAVREGASSTAGLGARGTVGSPLAYHFCKRGKQRTYGEAAGAGGFSRRYRNATATSPSVSGVATLQARRWRTLRWGDYSIRCASLRSSLGNPLQFQLHVARRLPAFFPIFRQASSNRMIERRRSQWPHCTDRHRFFLEDCGGNAQLVLAFKRWLASDLRTGWQGNFGHLTLDKRRHRKYRITVR